MFGTTAKVENVSICRSERRWLFLEMSHWCIQTYQLGKVRLLKATPMLFLEVKCFLLWSL